MGRLYETSGGASGTTRFLIDGDAMVAEYDEFGAMKHRYVHGADGKADDPIAWTQTGSSTQFLLANHQGSIVAVADAGGAATHVFRYDEYGTPEAQTGDTKPADGARFLYTGQMAISDLGMYYYKARVYSPSLGRFMQTDPIGYADQSNLYGYVGNDPVNAVDPTGTCFLFIFGKDCPVWKDDTKNEENKSGDIVVIGNRRPTMREIADSVQSHRSVGGDGEAGAQAAASLIIFVDEAEKAQAEGETVAGSVLVALGIKEGAGKNEAHGREPGAAQLAQLAKLEEQYKTSTGSERVKISNKIMNIRTNIASNRRGINHSTRKKR